MTGKLKILHLEDIPEEAELVAYALRGLCMPFQLKVVDTKDHYLTALGNYKPDIILSDHSLPGYNSIEALRVLRDNAIKTPFILVTATISDEFAVKVIKMGANDYILKEHMERLPKAIETAIDNYNLERSKEESEQRFRALIEYSYDMLTLIAADGRIAYTSPAVERTLGFTAAENQLRYATDDVHPDDLDMVVARLAIAAQSPDMPVACVLRNRKKDGNYIWMEGSLTNMFHVPGVKAIVANFRNITARRIAEETLARNEQLFKTLLENSQDGIMIYDAHWRIRYESQAVNRMTGYTPGELLGRHSVELVHPADAEQSSEFIKDVTANPGAPKQIQTMLRHADGHYIWIEGTVTNMLHDPNVNGIVANFRDITDRIKAQNALKASEDKFRSLIQHSSDAVTVINEREEIIFASDSLYKITGFTDTDMLYRSSREYVHPDDRGAINAVFTELMQNPGLIKNVLYRRLKKNGTYFWCEGVATNLMDDPAIGGIVINFRDISERKEVEQKLQQSLAELSDAAERQAAIINSLNANIALLNSNGVIVGVNESWERFADKNMLVSSTYCVGDNYIHISEQAEGAEAEYGRAVAAGIRAVLTGDLEEYSIDYPCNSADEERWFRANVTPLNQGLGSGVVISHTNITDSKLAQVRIQRSEANLNTIFNNGDTIYMLVDNNLKIVSYNHLATIYAMEQLVKPLREGDKLPECIPEDKRQLVQETLQQAFEGNEASYEHQYTVAGGAEKSYHTRYFPVSNEQHEVLGIIIVINDITQRKTEENKTLLLLKLLQQKNKDLSQFTYIVSHNLRAPITKIMGLVDLFNKGDDPGNEALLEYVANEAVNLDNVVKDLNAITSARDDSREAREFVTFEDELKLVMQVLEQEIAEAGAVITYHFPEKGIFTVKSYLYSILYNLLSNAIKYRSPSQQLTVYLQTKRENDFICLSVADNGMGIDLQRNAKKIFGLYKRFHGSSIPGKGIGLYLVKTHAEALGGTADVNSAINEGTTFKIAIPIS